MSVLVGTGLCHNFGGVTALRDVDIDAEAGELVGIIGPNGSGKTTLVDALTGLLRPQRGRLELGGIDVTECSAAALARRGVSRTFQNTRLMEPLSTRDNVALGLHGTAVGGRRRRRRCLDEMLARIGLEDLRDSTVRELSHGQRRRVELGRALVGTPRVLVLDEPTAGLFGPDVRDVVTLLATIAQTGTAIFMIEHDLGVIAAVCTRVVVLDGGAIVDRGATRTVLAGAAVAALTGELGRDRLDAVPA